MKIKKTIKRLVLPLFSILLLSSCGKDNTRWEYQVLEFRDNNILANSGIDSSFYPAMFDDPTSELNKLGEEGWELVSTYTAIETKFPNFGNKEYVTGIKENTRTAKICFVFKRKMTKSSNNNSNDSNTAPEEEDVVVVEEVAVDTTAAVVESSEVEVMPVQ